MFPFIVGTAMNFEPADVSGYVVQSIMSRICLLKETYSWHDKFVGSFRGYRPMAPGNIAMQVARALRDQNSMTVTC